MNIVMIVPTGIGAEIGGHAGDATSIVRTLSSICDNIIIHPNVVNASNLNEMSDNCWYVEGSILDRFLNREFNLYKPPFNRVMVGVNAPADGYTVNTVSAARVLLGLDAFVVELETDLTMISRFDKETGKATGDIGGVNTLLKQCTRYDFDALALVTPITVDRDVALNYVSNGGVNPWGGVEADLSKMIANVLNKPVAHAPKGSTLEDFNEVVDPRMAAEMISHSYLYCVLKGLQRAPRICYDNNKSSLNALNIQCMLSPSGCWGPPHKACKTLNMPIITVKENKTIYPERDSGLYQHEIIVNNYWEAIGVLLALKAGISIDSLRRPFSETVVVRRGGH